MDVSGSEAFVAANFEPVRRALTVALGDARQAEDVAQEAFARALSHWSTVSLMERPVAWVYVVAINHARREFRRDHRDRAQPVDDVMPEMAGAVATTVAIKTALGTLSPRQRTVVVLRYLADLSTVQVAEAMGCAEGTVKSTLSAALAHLRVAMEGEEQ